MTDVSRNELRPERPGDIPRLDLARELTEVSTIGALHGDALHGGLHGTQTISKSEYNRTPTVRKSTDEFHRNMNALTDPQGKLCE